MVPFSHHTSQKIQNYICTIKIYADFYLWCKYFLLFIYNKPFYDFIQLKSKLCKSNLNKPPKLVINLPLKQKRLMLNSLKQKSILPNYRRRKVFYLNTLTIFLISIRIITFLFIWIFNYHSNRSKSLKSAKRLHL